MTGRPADRETVDSSFYRPCWVEISASALRHNLDLLRSRLSPGTRILAVVKANGYGHGLLPASTAAVAAGAAYLGVSSVEEGLVLREAGFETPILILGSLFPFDRFSIFFDRRLTPTVASLAAADALDGLARRRGERLPVHLKIDSGFGRIGVSIPNALRFIRQVAERPGLEIEGLYTHFASSDVDLPFTETQAGAFLSVVEAAAEAGIRPRWIHMANSAAILRLPMTHGTLVRPGLALYGLPPYAGVEADVDLKPVLTWKTKIIFLKTVPAGGSISYARTWTAGRSSRIATLAVGYADGYRRVLSNRGQVLVRGRRVPVVGRVTMDMMMVDVTDAPDCRVGDEAVLLGRQGQEEIRAAELARLVETNTYEIVAGITSRVARVITDG